MLTDETTRLKQIIAILYRRLKDTRVTHGHGDYGNAWDYFEYDKQFVDSKRGCAMKIEIEQIAEEIDRTC